MKLIAYVFGYIALFVGTFFLLPISNAVRDESLSPTHLFVVIGVIFGSIILAGIFGLLSLKFDKDDGIY